MSEVDIMNAALSKLGEEPIESRDEDSAAARTLNNRYDAVRDAELRRRRWRFSIARTSLAALSTSPDSDYDNQFQIPNDFLRLIEGGDLMPTVNMADYRTGESALYSLEGRVILTNLPAPLAIRYIARITDTASFDVAFTEALASRLAFECCKKITGNDSEKETCKADYRDAIREAVRANALELAPQVVADDSWVTARAL